MKLSGTRVSILDACITLRLGPSSEPELSLESSGPARTSAKTASSSPWRSRFAKERMHSRPAREIVRKALTLASPMQLFSVSAKTMSCQRCCKSAKAWLTASGGSGSSDSEARGVWALAFGGAMRLTMSSPTLKPVMLVLEWTERMHSRPARETARNCWKAVRPMAQLMDSASMLYCQTSCRSARKPSRALSSPAGPSTPSTPALLSSQCATTWTK
mmetsp:Transcript_33966/g.91973  ORF Transcript_33966/g.91973 Transcript_33966/m.91973 type:complete len:216 (+) Transcript_33966:1536-2183(+)